MAEREAGAQRRCDVVQPLKLVDGVVLHGGTHSTHVRGDIVQRADREVELHRVAIDGVTALALEVVHLVQVTPLEGDPTAQRLVGAAELVAPQIVEQVGEAQRSEAGAHAFVAALDPPRPECEAKLTVVGIVQAGRDTHVADLSEAGAGARIRELAIRPTAIDERRLTISRQQRSRYFSPQCEAVAEQPHPAVERQRQILLRPGFDLGAQVLWDRIEKDRVDRNEATVGRSVPCA